MEQASRRKDKQQPQQHQAAPVTVELSSASSSLPSSSKAAFLDKVRESSRAVERGDYKRALQLYTDALAIDPANHILYSNRSAAYAKVRQFERALKDAQKARTLNPKWAKAYYREGVALQCMGQEAEALAAYASGLAAEPKNEQLLQGLVDAAMKTPLKDKFSSIYAQLEHMKLTGSAFVVIAVIGQELLGAGHFRPATVVLEAALRIGTCSLKLRGSVFSALSSAHWALGQVDKAIACMQQDLAVAKSLGDEEGECRAHSNLGSAYFSRGFYKESLQHHRFQLVLAMRLKERALASSALSSLGHVYTAIADYTNALASHKQCVLLVKQAHDRLQEAREIGNVGSVYLAMGNVGSALECHQEHLHIAKQMGNKVEEARAYSNMGSAFHYKRDYEKAVTFHKQVLGIAEELHDRTLEARAYAGLGHAARCMLDYEQAKHYHEKQLDNALQTKDKTAEGRACSNLGIIYQQYEEHDAALKLHKVHLQIAKDLGDRASQGRAYGNIGNAYSAMGQYDVAIRFHKQELAISREVCDRHSESSTHGNLAVAYQALTIHDKALHHYSMHLTMSQQLKDQRSESRALSNLANYHSSRKDYQAAVPLYEQHLAICQELSDPVGEGAACHKLGYVHYCLTQYPEAVRYYQQDLAIAKELHDQSAMCRAYCNLGLAHKAMGEIEQALECQKHFLATAHLTQNLAGKFCALGNLGDLMEGEEAIKTFQQQLTLAKQVKDRRFEATALGNLGAIYRSSKQLDKALNLHSQELTIQQELNDLKGECKAHANLGNVHMSLGNYKAALRSYEEQLDRGRDLKDSRIEALAYANLGITKMNLGEFEDAIGMFEQQLAMLEQLPGVIGEQGRAYGHLGDCYEALGDYDEAVRCYEQYLAAASSSNPADQDRAYRGLGNAHRAMGNLQQALVCFEKRLVVAHELDKPAAKSSAYGELGCLHSLLGNFEQAVACLQQQLRIAEEMEDRAAEGEAACGLGGVYQQMGEYDRALDYHQMDLQIAMDTNNPICQCRAHGNLGLSHESLGNFPEAIHHQEQHLAIAATTNDQVARTLALSSLGRVHHALGQYPAAVQYLSQGLTIAEQLGRKEDEAKIRHRLGLALWARGDAEDAQGQLYKAADLFECIRTEAAFNSDYKLSLFDLQTASYQLLQRVLVSVHRTDEALVVAERGRTRAFVDLLLERQRGVEDSWYQSLDSTPVTKMHITESVAKQKAVVLYFSLAAGFLYTWAITPDRGIVKFHESSVAELDVGSDPEDCQSLRSVRSLSASTASLLDGYVGSVREALGVESHLSTSRPCSHRGSFIMSETESDADDLWQQHLEEIGERLNAPNDRTGFLRMVNRSHVWNASSYSLSSLLSVGGSSTRSRLSTASSAANKPALTALYELLIAPMEDVLQSTEYKEVVLVLQGDLYLVPFALLRPSQAEPALYERFHLLAVPSIRALQASQTISKHNRYNPDCSGAVVIGNPYLPKAITDQWQWGNLPAAEQECRLVAEMVGCKPIIGSAATKERVVNVIQKAEVLHFATHISWKLSALVLAPGDFSSLSGLDLNMSDMGGPGLGDFLLTAADVLNVSLSARLVVMSSGHTDDRAGRINADGVVGLTRAFLAAGAQSVLFSLWPVPEMAARLLLRSFYTSLLQGSRASHALSKAMQAVQSSRTFSHPSNWASWLLLGADVRLSSKVALMGHALCQLLKSPAKSREAMRVVLHLVEKSLQRIHLNQRSPMYTTQQSIENKVGDTAGWRDLLTSVGFRFEPAGNAAGNPLPAAVFFPTSDPGDRLTQCSASLQALLGLSVPTLTAVSKMTAHAEVGEALTGVIKEALGGLGTSTGLQLGVPQRLWRAPGCHEFLASLGFDLVDVGHDEITLKAGKQANRRVLQFALQALVALFDTQEAPRTLLLDSSSSMESLASSGGSSSFSKASSPPTSPNYRKKSFFNPAEVEKMATAAATKNKASSIKSTSSRSSSSVSLALTHQNMIRQKYSSPSASDVSDREDAPTPPTTIATHALAVDTSRVLTGEEEEDHHEVQQQNLAPELLQLSPPGPRSSSLLFDRGGSARGFFPQPPPQNPYSTSASDSEDAVIPVNQLSKAMSQSRTSLASQSSTLTNRSQGSGGLRRNRHRSSMASTKSSASDKTLEPEEHLLGSTDTLTELVDEGQTTAKTSADSGLESQVSSQLSPSNSANSRLAPPKEPEPVAHIMKQKEVLESLDPTAVAQKVLAETSHVRMALEGMQRWSAQKVKQQQIVEQMQHYMKAREGPSPSVSSTANSPSFHDPKLEPGHSQLKKPSMTSSSTPSSVSSFYSPKSSSSTSSSSALSSNTLTSTPKSSLPSSSVSLSTPKVPPVLKPKPRPIMANSLRDVSPSSSNSSFKSNRTNHADNSSSSSSFKSPNRTIHEDIIETQLSRMELATIPESSFASSTDTDTDTVRSSIKKGALKSSLQTKGGKTKVVKFRDEVEVSDASSSDGAAQLEQVHTLQREEDEHVGDDEVFEEVPVDVGPTAEEILISKSRPVNVVNPTSAFTPSIPKRPPPAAPVGYVRPPPPPYPGPRPGPPAYGTRSPAESGGSSSDEVMTFRNKLQQASRQFFPRHAAPTTAPPPPPPPPKNNSVLVNGLRSTLSKPPSSLPPTGKDSPQSGGGKGSVEGKEWYQSDTDSVCSTTDDHSWHSLPPRDNYTPDGHGSDEKWYDQTPPPHWKSYRASQC